MIVLKDYDGFCLPTQTHPNTYLGLAQERFSRILSGVEMPESHFAQGKAAYQIGRTPQKSVYHLQVEGSLDAVERLASDRAYILKGTDGLNLQIDGTVHSGNCFVVSKKGDTFTYSTCWTRSISPLFSIFDVWSLTRSELGTGKIITTYNCYCLWEAENGVRKFTRRGASGSTGFKITETYNLEYLEEKYASMASENRTKAINDIMVDSTPTGYLTPFTLKRYSNDIESYYLSILPRISREIQFVASITHKNAYNIDPMKEARMGWLADAAIQGNLYYVESNMLEFWKESLSGTFGSEIKEWTEAISSLSKNRKGSASKVAKAYLSTTYGTRLTLNDMEQWQNAIAKYMWKSYNARAFAYAKAKSTHGVSRPTASLQDGVCDYSYSLCYDPLEKFGGSYGIKELLNTFRLSPNAKRVWELLPFSFVVDWFLPISELYRVIESEDMLYDMKYRVFGETSSTKYTFPFAQYPSLAVVLYSRTCSKIPFTTPLPDLEDLNPLNRGVSGSAAVNGTALILSKRRPK